MRFHSPSHTRYAEADNDIDLLYGKIRNCVGELRRIAEELDLEAFTIGYLARAEDSLDYFTREAKEEIERVEEEREKK